MQQNKEVPELEFPAIARTVHKKQGTTHSQLHLTWCQVCVFLLWVSHGEVNIADLCVCFNQDCCVCSHCQVVSGWGVFCNCWEGIYDIQTIHFYIKYPLQYVCVMYGCVYVCLHRMTAYSRCGIPPRAGVRQWWYTTPLIRDPLLFTSPLFTWLTLALSLACHGGRLASTCQSKKTHTSTHTQKGTACFPHAMSLHLFANICCPPKQDIFFCPKIRDVVTCECNVCAKCFISLIYMSIPTLAISFSTIYLYLDLVLKLSIRYYFLRTPPDTGIINC